MKRKLVFPMILCLIVTILQIGPSGCNTMQGLGQDVEALGKKIEDKAAKKKRY